MPYIPAKDRHRVFDRGIPQRSPGELNFAFTSWIVAYVDTHGLSYKTINDVLGALEGAKMEFYRRVAVPYENGKLSQNGDVY